ncbi:MULTISPECIES: type II toxin-antitoxin system RelE/ParE family toxin [unclassified Sphingomonas]|uniref:type II toxin-antitoxin system RelE/ParE family toxin n=1 Tax=unclassified Sphingomonas TaxID=196159 RepID=UPI000BCDD7CC|nr:MAG: hypothetical protein B7Y98_06095 [Sphingomonas sp. 32-62-10]
MRLELSRRAEADLLDIRDYSVEQFGIDRAVLYLDGIEDAFRLLIDFPKTGSLHPTLTPSVRSMACQRHRIFYVIEGDAVVIRRILHSAMDAARHL